MGARAIENQLSECAKCGACTAVCPVYQVTGRESLTARGRLHLLASLNRPEAATELAAIFSKCLLCGACRAVCPRGIDIPAIIMEARASMPQVTGFSSFKKYLAQQALGRPALLTTFSKAARPLRLLADLLPAESGLRFALAGLSPQFSIESCQLPARLAASHPPSRQALYFSGCLAGHLAPSIGAASEILLARLCDYALLTPGGQNCCGLAARSAGDLEQAKELARRTIALFSEQEIAHLPVFTSCASCYVSLKGSAGLLANDPIWRQPAQAFAERVCEFSSFILQHTTPLAATAFQTQTPPHAILYHDPCHLRNAGIVDEPRQLMRLAPGLTPLELPHGPRCCGMGGLFRLAHADLSGRIVAPLLDDVERTNAATVVSSCTGCLLQWQESLTLRGGNNGRTATHLALALASQLSA